MPKVGPYFNIKYVNKVLAKLPNSTLPKIMNEKFSTRAFLIYVWAYFPGIFGNLLNEEETLEWKDDLTK